MKKGLVFLLVAALVFSVFPMNVLAEQGSQPKEPSAAEVALSSGEKEQIEELVLPLKEEQGEKEQPAFFNEAEDESQALADEMIPMAVLSGDCGAQGNNVQWSLDTATGILNINGTGAMRDWQWFDTVPWDANKNDIKEVVVGSGVTSVGGYAFDQCSALQSVVLPSGLLTIGQFAFSQCTSLENINFPNSLTSIKTQAFNSCKIASLDLSGHTSLGNLESYAFAKCSALSSVKLPDQMTEIGRDAFADCSSLVEVKLPANLQKIGMSAFEGCRSLERVEFPATLTNLELAAFKATKLKIIVFNGMAAPAVVMGAFVGNPPGGTLYYPTGGTGYDSGTFVELASYNWVFYDETQPNLQVQFPIPRTGDNSAQVTFTSSKSGRLYCFLEPWTMERNPSFEEAKAYAMANGTYKDCTQNQQTTLNITNLVRGAYNIRVVLETPGGVQRSAILGQKLPKYIPNGECGSPNAADITWQLDRESGVLTFDGNGGMEDFDDGDAPWYEYRDDIKTVFMDDAITHIGEFAFIDCVMLETMDLPDSLVSIGACAFQSCAALEAIDFSSSVLLTQIGDQAFGGSGLAAIDLSANVNLEKISEFTFWQCAALTDAALPTGIESIGASAFAGCSSLESVNFPSSLEEIGSFAFQNAAMLDEADLSGCNLITKINEGVFEDCALLKNVLLPASLTEIGDTAFSNCAVLEDIDFSSLVSLELIGNHAFVGCAAITTADLSDCVLLETIGDSAFRDCSVLFDVALPASIENIGEWAFENCDALTEIDLSHCTALDTVRDRTFSDCNALWKVVLPSSIEAIGDGAFAFCPSLDTLIFASSNAPNLGSQVFDGAANLGTLYYPKDASGYVRETFGAPHLNGWLFRSTPAVLTIDSTERVSEQTANVSFISSEDVEYYYEMVAHGAPAPVIGTSGAGSSLSKNVVETISLTGLLQGQRYDLYLVAKDGIGNISATILFEIPLLKYDLTVQKGTGSGSYVGGAMVEVRAEAPTQGKKFSHWTSSVPGVLFANPNSAQTTVTMPYEAVTVTAVYQDVLYQATVTGGTGSGSYIGGATVNVVADAPAQGKSFSRWISSSAEVLFADETNPSTSFTMPFSDAVVRAEYADRHTNRTLKHDKTGITVEGWFTQDAALDISSDRITHPELLSRQKEGKLMVLHEITAQGHRGDEVTVSIPVGNEYNGKTLTVLHGLEDGTVERKQLVVSQGRVTGTFESLSPYAVEKPAETSPPTPVAPAKTNTTGAAKTGDESELALWIGLMLAAACVVGIIAYRKIAEKKIRNGRQS